MNDPHTFDKYDYWYGFNLKKTVNFFLNYNDLMYIKSSTYS